MENQKLQDLEKIFKAGDDAFIDLSRNEARKLAQTIIEHCDEAEK